jgi:hypothetical protein
VALDLEQVAHELTVLLVVFDDEDKLICHKSSDNSPAKHVLSEVEGTLRRKVPALKIPKSECLNPKQTEPTNRKTKTIQNSESNLPFGTLAVFL